MKNKISPELLEMIEKTVMSCGVELYDIEFKSKILRILITKDQGISIDTCAKVSEAISAELDLKDLIPTRFFLEVSSPGIERRLRGQKDFEVSVGHRASIRTQTGNFVGIILKADNNGIEIKNTAGSLRKTDTVEFIAYKNINFARLVVTDDQLFNREAGSKNLASVRYGHIKLESDSDVILPLASIPEESVNE